MSTNAYKQAHCHSNAYNIAVVQLFSSDYFPFFFLLFFKFQP